MTSITALHAWGSPASSTRPWLMLREAPSVDHLKVDLRDGAGTLPAAVANAHHRYSLMREKLKKTQGSGVGPALRTWAARGGESGGPGDARVR